MNRIQRLQHDLIEAYPDASTTLEPPLRQGGIWSLDANLRGKQLVIEWSETTGFGISSPEFETFGEAADERIDSYSVARRRVEELLSTEQGTVPPVAVLLSRLRAKRGVTQKELAQKLAVSQATISGMERRRDMQLSTLCRCIQALEGTVEIFAVFSDARYRIDNSQSLLLSASSNYEREPCRSRGGVDYRFDSLRQTGFYNRASQFAAATSDRHSVIEMPG